MMQKYEFEFQRHNVTPAQFLAYVRHMMKKSGHSEEVPDLDYWRRGGDIEFDYHDDPARPAAAERSVSKPYEMQTYIRNWDGTVYNLICEFDFWDEKTGFGYFYLINTWNDETTETTETTETEKEEDQQMDTKVALQKIETARAEIERKPGRGAWARGVAMYAEELLEGLSESVAGGWLAPDDLAAPCMVKKALLNGAADWKQYSWGGSALIYDPDIAERLCNPTELKRTDGGHKRPNSREEWLDTQARALFQASHRARAALAAALG